MSQPLIFITGATGFIGAHVVTQALAANHRVRLSVRKESQIPTLRNLFSSHAANLSFTVIPDFTAPGAFAKALDGVTYIFHLASPMPGTGSDFQADYVAPAVDGTLALLNAATQVPTIKRVVIVSSLLALIPLDALLTQQFTATEGLSPPIDPQMSFPPDPRAAAGLKYHASKILAHRATLSWYKTSAPQFSVVTLHPSFVFGPNLLQTSPDALDGTNAMLWASLTSSAPMIPMAAVDVRDVAGAHLRALDAAGDGLEEFILSAGVEQGWTWEGVVGYVRREFGFVDVKLEGPFGEPPSVHAGKAGRVLGVRWRKMEDTVGAFLGQQRELRGRL